MSSTSSLSALVRNFSSTEVGSISVLAQENWSGLTPFLNVTVARLAHQRQVFAVVDRQLHRVALGTVERSTLLPAPSRMRSTRPSSTGDQAELQFHGCHLRRLERHVVLLALQPWWVTDLKEQVGLLPGVDGAVNSQFGSREARGSAAAEHDIAGEAPADLHIDRLGGIIADSLRANLRDRPSRRRWSSLRSCAAPSSARRRRSPPLIRSQILSRNDRSLISSKIDVGIGAEVQLDLVADGDVFDRLRGEEGEPVAAIVAKDADHAVGERRGAELRFLVVGQQVHPDELVAILLGR